MFFRIEKVGNEKWKIFSFLLSTSLSGDFFIVQSYKCFCSYRVEFWLREFCDLIVVMLKSFWQPKVENFANKSDDR